MRFQSAGVLTLAGMLAAASAFAGQGAAANTVEAVEVAPMAEGETYGTTALTAAVVTVFDCDTFAQSDTWIAVMGTPNRFLTAGAFECGLSFPAGSQVIRIEVEACDTSATAEVVLNFLRTTTAGGAGNSVAVVSTGLAAVPGCGRFPFTLPAPETVDNVGRKYFFQITTGNTNATTLAGARAYYRLQVSPAPSSASFGDVPTTHPFFRFVEALVASGITGGCGGGNYCPDDAVTRGQMAVFLATALGLHFAP